LEARSRQPVLAVFTFCSFFCGSALLLACTKVKNQVGNRIGTLLFMRLGGRKEFIKVNVAANTVII
jgi:hypothetical protein